MQSQENPNTQEQSAPAVSGTAVSRIIEISPLWNEDERARILELIEGTTHLEVLDIKEEIVKIPREVPGAEYIAFWSAALLAGGIILSLMTSCGWNWLHGAFGWGASIEWNQALALIGTVCAMGALVKVCVDWAIDCALNWRASSYDASSCEANSYDTGFPCEVFFAGKGETSPEETSAPPQ